MKLKYLLFLNFLCMSSTALAFDGIVRPYQSVRYAAMGSVRMTTGLYDENFFNNPARATANPNDRVTLFQLMPLEGNGRLFRNRRSITNELAMVDTIYRGNIHYRNQLIMPAFYWNDVGDHHLYIATGLISSLQLDCRMLGNLNTDVNGLIDIGPSVTVAKKYLDDQLSLGVTAHLAMRVGIEPVINGINYFVGPPGQLGIEGKATQGTMLDFDLGSTYTLLKWDNLTVNTGVAVQNILGGNFSNIPFRPFKAVPNRPPVQPRSLGGGFSAEIPHFFGILQDTVAAFEITDIGNNANGSFFRLLHLGAETHFQAIGDHIAFRFGINQGYFTLGAGLNYRNFTLDVGTYAEELGLNTGILEDRRYAFNIGFHL